MANRRDKEVRSGQRSINEARSELNLPLIDSPIADTPMLIAGTAIYTFTSEGLVPVDKPTEEPTSTGPQISGEEDAEVPQNEVEQINEVKAFLKWAKKGNTDRDFEFKSIKGFYASALNQAAKTDYQLTKSIAEDLLKKK